MNYKNKQFKRANIVSTTKLKAFTLVELLVATMISSVVLVAVFAITSDVLDEAVFTNKSVSSFTVLYNIKKELNKYKNIYSTGTILINKSSGSGSDVFIFLNTDNTKGILVGNVNNYNMELVPDSNYSLYQDNSLGFRRLSASEVSSVLLNPSSIYSSIYKFQKDKIFSDLKLKDIQMTSYNSGSILEIDFSVNLFFNENLDGEDWNTLPKERVVNFTIDY